MTEAQKRFCDEYLVHLNATKAYKVAYPNCKKDETARKLGSRLMTKDDVKEYIEERQEKLQKRIGITQEKILQELAAIGFSNATQFAEVKGNFVKIKDTSQLDDNTKKAIVEISEGKSGVKIKTASKVQALELLRQTFGNVQRKNRNIKISSRNYPRNR